MQIFLPSVAVVSTVMVVVVFSTAVVSDITDDVVSSTAVVESQPPKYRLSSLYLGLHI